MLRLTATLDDVLNLGTIVDPSLGQASIHASEATLANRFPSRRAVLDLAAQHFVLEALRRGRLPQLQELHPGAVEHDAGPLRHRRLVRRRRDEQGMATTIGRRGISGSDGPLRPGMDNWVASLARSQRRRAPRGCCKGQRDRRPFALGYGKNFRRRRRCAHA